MAFEVSQATPPFEIHGDDISFNDILDVIGGWHGQGRLVVTKATRIGGPAHTRGFVVQGIDTGLTKEEVLTLAMRIAEGMDLLDQVHVQVGGEHLVVKKAS